MHRVVDHDDVRARARRREPALHRVDPAPLESELAALPLRQRLHERRLAHRRQEGVVRLVGDHDRVATGRGDHRRRQPTVLDGDLTLDRLDRGQRGEERVLVTRRRDHHVLQNTTVRHAHWRAIDELRRRAVGRPRRVPLRAVQLLERVLRERRARREAHHAADGADVTLRCHWGLLALALGRGLRSLILAGRAPHHERQDQRSADHANNCCAARMAISSIRPGAMPSCNTSTPEMTKAATT